jgi:hypothetical protein
MNIGAEELNDQLNLYLLSEPANSHQTFRSIGALSSKDNPQNGQRSISNYLINNHSYQPNAELSVANLLSLVKTNYSMPATPQTPTKQDSGFNSQQLSSFSSFRPQGSPLTVTGSAQLLRTYSETNGTSTPADTNTNLNLGANYAWSPLLNMYGSINVSDSNGVQSVSTAASMSAQKGFGDKNVSNFDDFKYTRTAGASIGNSTITTTAPDQTTTTHSVQNIAGNLGHDLSKSTKIGSGRLNMDLNQTLAELVSSSGPPRSNLSTGGSLAFNKPDNKGTTVARLSVRDARNLRYPSTYFQVINFQLSRRENMGRDQSLIGNLTMNSSRSGDYNHQTPFIAAPSADLTYRNIRLFRKRNLNFDSTLSYQGATIASSKNDPSFTPTEPSVNWDNSLSYFIGRLKMNLHTHMAEIGKSKQSSILFNMDRSF